MVDPLLALTIALALIALLSIFYWPQQGLYPRWQRARHLTRRVRQEDALKHLYARSVHSGPATVQGVAGALQINLNQAADLLDEMAERGLLHMDAHGLHLTADGKAYALHMIRSHRLYERYLAEETGYGEAEWHDRAERAEHQLSTTETDTLAGRLGYPSHDPHGDPIPTAGGHVTIPGGMTLNAAMSDVPLRIVHLEDEPDAVYAQLVALGLYPGMSVQVLESGANRIRLWADGTEHVLAPIVAANITVVAQESAATEMGTGDSAAILKPGETGQVIRISPRCLGKERRRLLDLGIVPGATIEAAFASPGGDPMAYRVRDTLIALREEQAKLINVERKERGS